MADLEKLAKEAKEYAEANPWSPMMMKIPIEYKKQFEYMDCHFAATLTHTNVPPTSAWQLSISTEEHGANVPQVLLEMVARIFMPVPYISFGMPNSQMFVEDNKVGKMLKIISEVIQ